MRARFFVTSLALVAVSWTPAAFSADDDIFGTWDFTLKFQGNDIKVGLSLAKNSDDRIVGLWAVGEDWTTLPKVTYKDGKLTFDRTMNANGQNILLKHEATFKDGKIMGKIISPQGELAFEGAKRTKATRQARGRGGEGRGRQGFDIVALIKQNDADGDGKLQKSEAPEQMQRFFNVLDTDGDGAIGEDEAKAAMERFSQSR